ncbi:hypothetical protein [Kribbella sp. NPDC051718]|uniref:hypothetical protein n=1 Tax=Kribbella sp. NPDC051718 TaxID=3155168 RepID=UPI00341CF49C
MPLRPPGSTGPRGREPHAGELFTDRMSESQAFRTALRAFRRRLDADEDSDSRYNVLTYYGVGGIGKTALSARLQAWVDGDLPLVTGWGSTPDTKVDATIRVDLHTSSGQIDLLSLVLAIRRGLVPVRPSLPIFDFALAAYWSAVKPGTPMPAQSPNERRVRDGVIETIADVAQDVGLLDSVAGLGVRGVRLVMNEIRRRRQKIKAFDAYPDYEQLVGRCLDEPSPTSPRPDLLSEIAYVLSYELSLAERMPLIVIFIDTTERLSIDHRRHAEFLLNDLIHQLPNMLFVLTGRNMLDWWDYRRTNLAATGPAIWPGLLPGATEEPRQHLIGKLSDDDTRFVIVRARQLLKLPIPDSVVEELVTSSGGLPQYLELARQVAIGVRDNGGHRQVTVDDVTGSLGDLVSRVLEDIPADEQRAIRAGALFRAFDLDLLAAAAGVDHGCAQRAVRRPMIDMVPGERFPYRIHDEIRSALRAADSSVIGGWSPHDWQAAATRAVAEIRRVHDKAKEAEDSAEVQRFIAAAITIVCQELVQIPAATKDGYADWLTQAIIHGPTISGLGALIPPVASTTYGDLVLKFVAGKSAVALDERLGLLREVARSAHPLSVHAARHAAYTLRTFCQWDEALAVLDEVIARAPSDLHRRQRPETMSRARRFRDSLVESEGRPEHVAMQREADFAHGRLDGVHLHMLSGDVARLREGGREREYLQEAGAALMRRTLLGECELEEISALQADCELVGHNLGLGHALLSLVLHHRADPAMVSVALERLHALDLLATGVIGYRYTFGALWGAYVAEDRELAARLADEVDDRPLSRGRAWIPIECLFQIMGSPLRSEVPTQWLGPYDEVVARWKRIFETARSRFSAD